MYLEEIILSGFKSFPEKIHLTLPPGITVIVGPNGCGKSNLIDAVRWALGEQSAKHMRGDSMEDVIFNGNKNRKPLGMAEVSLRFVDPAGVLPLEYSEILITRRVFRSGEGEYFLNKKPCRLRDIQELFMDTGIGARAYSIAEQGKIDLIIHAKPEERRALIEEAAGITKYKARKKATLEKLEATRLNLTRVQDIILEVQRQLESVKRQVKKAERYQSYLNEIKALQTRLYRSRYRALGEKLEQSTLLLQTLQGEVAQLKTEISALQEEAIQKREKLQKAEENLNTIRQQLQGVSSTIQLHEAKLEQLRQQLLDQKIILEKGDEILSRLRKEQEETEEEIQAQKTQWEELSQEITHYQRNLESQEESVKILNFQLSEAQAQLDKEKGQLMNLLMDLTRGNNLILRLKKDKERVSLNLIRLKKEREAIEVQRKEKEAELESLKGVVQELQEKRGELDKTEPVLKEKIQGIEKTLQELDRKISLLKDRLSLNRSRYESLKELQKTYAGFKEGTRSLLLNPDLSQRLGIQSTVLDLIKAKPGYEVAIEAILGDKIQTLIVETYQKGIEAIGFLRETKSGRGYFMPFRHGDTVSWNTEGQESKNQGIIPASPGLSVPASILNEDPDIIGKAFDFITCKAEFKETIQILLDSIVVVENLEKAIRVHQKYPFLICVTRGGEVLDSQGVLYGGASQRLETGFLAKKGEMDRLKQQVENYERGLQRLLQVEGEIKNKLELYQGALKNLEKTRREQEINLINKENAVNQLERDLEQLRKRLEFIDLEQSQLSQEITGIDGELSKTLGIKQNLEEKKVEKEERIADLQNKVQQSREQQDQAVAGLTDSKVHYTALKEKLRGLDQDIRRLTERNQSLALQIQETQERITTARNRREEYEIAIQETQDVLESLLDSREKLEKKEKAHQEKHFAAARELENTERILKEREESYGVIHEKLKAEEIKNTELRVTLEHIKERITSELGLPLEEFEVREETSFTSTTSRTSASPLSDQEIEESIEALKEKLANLGNVNLAAIEEYQALQERYDFLSNQQADLTESMNSLYATIQKIDATTEARFIEAFNTINASFKGVFQKLFEGGSAELRLTDPGNILETGVEILAQPSGKRLQKISLMSGGEKALISIALLFSIFLIKPSPFCILDEVDAPLDDANVGRFLNLLQDMARTTQFIIITHNKRTMEIAHLMYGITMEEPGVSKIVSVQLNN
ncbi:MAG TPA: chromosome segregation protein SMC [Candidatus Limnocylindrales bacterium]|nr:chromosome segregation protein SMC [Candidatus Limnocylindrales bacterium]